MKDELNYPILTLYYTFFIIFIINQSVIVQMKPEYEKILEKPDRSFTAKTVVRSSRPFLSQAWHFHPEIEICLTKKSSGRRFTGNQISDYQENDLVMFGSNLPHGFTTDVFSSQVVIQLNADFLGKEFIDSPELKDIKGLFYQAQHGLEFNGPAKKKAVKIIEKLLISKGMNQLLYLMKLLNVLAQADDVKWICSEEYALDLNVGQLGRIGIVYKHIMDNFNRDVSIKEISDKLNISEAAFYKFIKKQTKKTYTQIINEFRINYAAKLLMGSDKTIAQISFECGYNHPSYFNRKFKEIMNKTPQAFRSHFASQIIQ